VRHQSLSRNSDHGSEFFGIAFLDEIQSAFLVVVILGERCSGASNRRQISPPLNDGCRLFSHEARDVVAQLLQIFRLERAVLHPNALRKFVEAVVDFNIKVSRFLRG
jgi:hypothetical protein